MPFKKLPIETWGEYAPPQCAVRIRRQSDSLFFDQSDGKFKPEASCDNLWVTLVKSTSPNSPNSVEAFVDVDPAQWKDGDYTVYFHDLSVPIKKLFAISEVAVFEGDPATRRSPNITEIAGRVLDCTVTSHKGVGTVGAWMLDVTAKLADLTNKVNTLQMKVDRLVVTQTTPTA